MKSTIDITELLSEAFNLSKSEVRRKIKQQAFKLNGELINSIEFECSPNMLNDKIIQFGKRKFRKIKWNNSTNDFEIWH
jgi:tyrosyl-tRNA synthetase